MGFSKFILMSKERVRAWIRFKSHIKLGKGQGSGSCNIEKPEKKWKMMYCRSNKLARAKQLGFEYPRKKLTDRID